jgi:hypothetical protein
MMMATSTRKSLVDLMVASEHFEGYISEWLYPIIK